MNIIELAREAGLGELGERSGFIFYQPGTEGLHRFAALVRAKDEALLRQALEALEKAHHAMQADMAQEVIEDAITAMRERLGEKT